MTTPEDIRRAVDDAIQKPMPLEDAIAFVQELQELLGDTLVLLREDQANQDQA